MTTNRQREGRHDRPAWRSLRQLSDLWGLSRGRTGLVLDGLVRSGRMEVRRGSRERNERREYRPSGERRG